MMPNASEPIRVGFVLHVMQVAGAEVLVRECIRQLGVRIEPTLLCLDGVGAIGEELRANGVALLTLDRRPGRDWRVPRRIARIIDDRKIDILHAHQYTPLFYAALAKVLSRRTPRLVFTEHGRHYPDVVSAKRRWVNRLLFERLIDAITAVCTFTRDSLIEAEGFASRKITVIENGIKPELYRATDNKEAAKVHLGLDPSRRYITTIARFHPVKGHTTLLRAFREVANARNDTDLLLAGDGPQRAELVEMCRSLGITTRVRFLGVRSDVPALLQASDVFALTSLSEAASLTLLEAMASGVPCVVTAVGGNPELLRDGIDGLLVPRGDVASAADAMLHILNSPQVAAEMGAAGTRRVRERFMLRNTVESYWEVYQRLFYSKRR